MVSAGEISSASSTISSHFSKYNEGIAGLAGAWEGSSYSNLISKANEFSEEFEGKIVEQLSSFAEAVSEYEQYKQAKQNHKNALAAYNAALLDEENNNISYLLSQVNKYESLMKNHKAAVNAALQQVKSVKLDAGNANTSISVSAAGSSGSGAGNGSNNASVNSSGLTNPLGNYRVTSEFGYRGNIGVAGATADHHGIDLGGNPIGTPIHAAQGGTIVVSSYGNNGGRGNYVVIDHGNGIKTLYQHCSELDVNVGDVVEAGADIAKVGNSGVGSGPHLHLEVLENDVPVDPRKYFNF